MRTTIELPDSQRARLLELAARRGEKGFSGIIQEAIALYLEHEAKGADRLAAAVAARGALRGAAGERLDELAREARESWR